MEEGLLDDDGCHVKKMSMVMTERQTDALVLKEDDGYNVAAKRGNADM